MPILKGFLEVMKVRQISKNYKVVTHYTIPLVNHSSYNIFLTLILSENKKL